MTLNIVGRKLEDGTFKVAIVADGKFADADKNVRLPDFINDSLIAVFASMAPDDRVEIHVGTQTEKK